MRDYYVVIVLVGGILYKTDRMLLDDAERSAESFLLACPNSAPQVVWDSAS